MTTVIQRLRLFEYEAATDTGEYCAQEEGHVLDDEEVARLLLSAPEPAEPDSVREPVAAIEAVDQSDGLAAMRGVMIGLAWAAAAWGLIAGIVLLP